MDSTPIKYEDDSDEKDDILRFVSYSEYKLECIINGRKPEERSDIGSFVLSRMSATQKPMQGNSELFSLLQKDGILNKEKIELFADKLNADTRLLLDIFYKGEITETDFKTFIN
ncbi:hypothetical protein GINT2_000820 [Glugoides intestinalis]